MRRRDFINGIVGSATVWPLATWAQQALVSKNPFIGDSYDYRTGFMERKVFEKRHPAFYLPLVSKRQNDAGEE
jgi:hypothetical protein